MLERGREPENEQALGKSEEGAGTEEIARECATIGRNQTGC